jgi:Zn-dependent metalloprotease
MTEATEAQNRSSKDDNTVHLPSDDLSAFLKEHKDYLAYQVAEAARQQLVSWAKWIIGAIALLITILGVKTYIDVQKNIDNAITQELTAARAKTREALDKFTIETNSALDKLTIETELVKAEAERAGTLIAEQTTQVKTKYTLFMGALPVSPTPQPVAGLTRTIYDAKAKDTLPGTPVRSEGAPPSEDPIVNEVCDNIAIVYKFMNDAFGIKLFPLDGHVIAVVHYSVKYDNRFWDGKQLVLGDGDGVLFSKFSGLGSIAGALAYPLIDEKTKLPYKEQQGALVKPS